MFLLSKTFFYQADISGTWPKSYVLPNVATVTCKLHLIDNQPTNQPTN